MKEQKDTTKPEAAEEQAVGVDALVMVRPCEREIVTKVGTVTPEDTNRFASNIQGFCLLIRDLDSLDEVKAVAEAINDNWNRYMDSA